MPSFRDTLRPLLSALRARGIDFTTPHRRNANDAIAVQRHLLRRRPVKAVLDCGAHHGRLSLQYSQLFPDAHIYAFEPTPDTFKVLQANVAAHPRITPINAAVGEHPGEVPFHISSDEQANSLLMPGDPTGPTAAGPSHYQSTVPVRVETIDTFCESRSIRHIDILKLDIEGHELPALRGGHTLLGPGNIDLIMAEFRIEDPRPEATRFIDLASHLSHLRYHLWGFYGLLWDENLRTDWGDAIWVSDPIFRSLYPNA